MERQHHRHAALFGGAHDGRAEEQQRIVDVDSVDVLLFYDIPHVAGGSAVPDGAKGQQCLSRAVGGLLIAALIDDDGVAVLLQQGALRGKDGVLAARAAGNDSVSAEFSRSRLLLQTINLL